MLDWALVLTLTSPLWVVALGHVKHSAAFSAASVADDGLLSLLALRWGDAGESAASGLSEVWGSVASTVVAVAAAQVPAVALYDFVAHAWLGRTPGKVVASLAVAPLDGSRRVRPGRALTRTALTVLLPGAGWVVLIAGVLWMDVLLLLLGPLLLALSLVECLALRGPACRHDRRARTVVRPVDWAARIAAVRGSPAWAATQQVSGRVLDQGRAALRDRFGPGAPPPR